MSVGLKLTQFNSSTAYFNACCLCSDGLLYASTLPSTSISSLYQISPTTGSVDTYASTSNTIYALCTDGTYLWAAGAQSGGGGVYLAKYTIGLGNFSFANSYTAGSSLQKLTGICWDGTQFWASDPVGYLWKITTAGVFTSYAYTVSGGGSYPGGWGGICFDGQNVWMNSFNGEILKVPTSSPTSGTIITLPSNGITAPANYGNSICYDGQGSIYAVGTANGSSTYNMVQINKVSNAVHTINLTTPSSSSVALGSICYWQGNLYVTQAGSSNPAYYWQVSAGAIGAPLQNVQMFQTSTTSNPYGICPGGVAASSVSTTNGASTGPWVADFVGGTWNISGNDTPSAGMAPFNSVWKTGGSPFYGNGGCQYPFTSNLKEILKYGEFSKFKPDPTASGMAQFIFGQYALPIKSTGNITGNSSISRANLTNRSSFSPISASLSGSGSLTDTVKAIGVLHASLSGSGALSDTDKGIGVLKATCTGSGSVSAGLKGKGNVVGTSTGLSSFSSAHIKALGTLIGSSTGLSTLSTAHLIGIGKSTAPSVTGGPGLLTAFIKGLALRTSSSTGLGTLTDTVKALGLIHLTSTGNSSLAAIERAYGKLSSTITGLGQIVESELLGPDTGKGKPIRSTWVVSNLAYGNQRLNIIQGHNSTRANSASETALDLYYWGIAVGALSATSTGLGQISNAHAVVSSSISSHLTGSGSLFASPRMSAKNGTITGSSTLSNVHETALGKLSASPIGLSSLSPTLKVPGKLSSSPVGLGTLFASPRIASKITGQSSLAAHEIAIGKLSSTCTGLGSVLASLRISARTTGSSTLTNAHLTGTYRMQASITGSGTLFASPRLYSKITGLSSLSAHETALGKIIGTSTGLSSLSAHGSVLGKIAMSTTGQSSLAAHESALGRIGSSISGSGSISDTIKGLGKIVGVSTGFGQIVEAELLGPDLGKGKWPIRTTWIGSNLTYDNLRSNIVQGHNSGRQNSAIEDAMSFYMFGILAANIQASLSGSGSMSDSIKALGVVVDSATGQGSLRASPRMSAVNGTIVGNSSISAHESAKGKLSATLSGNSSLSPSIKALAKTSSSPSGAGSLFASPRISAKNGTIVGISSLVSRDTAIGKLVGASTGLSTISTAVLKSSGQLHASLSGTGTILASPRMFFKTSGSSSLSAHESALGKMSGSSTGQTVLFSSPRIASLGKAIGNSSIVAHGSSIGRLSSTIAGNSSLSAHAYVFGKLSLTVTGVGTLTDLVKGIGKLSSSTSGSGQMSSNINLPDNGKGVSPIRTVWSPSNLSYNNLRMNIATGHPSIRGPIEDGMNLFVFGLIVDELVANLTGQGQMSDSIKAIAVARDSATGSGTLFASPRISAKNGTIIGVSSLSNAHGTATGKLQANLTGTSTCSAVVKGAAKSPATIAGSGSLFASPRMSAKNGTIVGLSTLAGHETAKGYLSGAGTGQGSLFASPRIASLGKAIGNSSLAAHEIAIGKLSGTCAGLGSITLASPRVAAKITGSSSTNMPISAKGKLVAALVGAGNISSAVMSTSGKMIATISGHGTLFASPRLYSKLTGSGTVSAHGSEIGKLISTPVGQGSLFASPRMSFKTSGSSSLAAHEIAIGKIIGTSIGSGQISDVIKGQGKLQATSTGQSSLYASAKVYGGLRSSIVGNGSLYASSSLPDNGKGVNPIRTTWIGSNLAYNNLHSNILVAHNSARGVSEDAMNFYIFGIIVDALAASISGIGSLSDSVKALGVIGDSISGHGALFASPRISAKNGTIVGAGNYSAALKAYGSITATITGGGTLTGHEKAGGKLQASSTGSGTLFASPRMAAKLVGSSSISATTKANSRIVSSPVGQGTLSNTIKGYGKLQSALSGSGAISRAVPRIAAKLSGSNTMSGSATAKGSLAANIIGNSSLHVVIQSTDLGLGRFPFRTTWISPIVYNDFSANVMQSHGATRGVIEDAMNLFVFGKIVAPFLTNSIGASSLNAPAKAPGRLQSNLTGSGSLRANLSLVAISTGSGQLSASIKATGKIQDTITGSGVLADTIKSLGKLVSSIVGNSSITVASMRTSTRITGQGSLFANLGLPDTGRGTAPIRTVWAPSNLSYNNTTTPILQSHSADRSKSAIASAMDLYIFGIIKVLAQANISGQGQLTDSVKALGILRESFTGSGTISVANFRSSSKVTGSGTISKAAMRISDFMVGQGQMTTDHLVAIGKLSSSISGSGLFGPTIQAIHKDGASITGQGSFSDIINGHGKLSASLTSSATVTADEVAHGRLVSNLTGSSSMLASPDLTDKNINGQGQLTDTISAKGHLSAGITGSGKLQQKSYIYSESAGHGQLSASVNGISSRSSSISGSSSLHSVLNSDGNITINISGNGSMSGPYLRAHGKLSAALSGSVQVNFYLHSKNFLASNPVGQTTVVCPITGQGHLHESLTGSASMSANIQGSYFIGSSIVGTGYLYDLIKGIANEVESTSGHSSLTGSLRSAGRLSGAGSEQANIVGIVQASCSIAGHGTIQAALEAPSSLKSHMIGHGDVGYANETATASMRSTTTGHGQFLPPTPKLTAKEHMQISMIGSGSITMASPRISSFVRLGLFAPSLVNFSASALGKLKSIFIEGSGSLSSSLKAKQSYQAQLTGAGSLHAHLIGIQKRSASFVGQSILTSVVKAIGKLWDNTTTGVGTLTNFVKGIRESSANLVGSTGITKAKLSAIGKLKATISGQTSFRTAAINGQARLSGHEQGSGALAAVISNKGVLRAAIQGHSALIGSIHAQEIFRSAIVGRTSVAANLQGAVSISTSISGHGIISEALLKKTVQGRVTITGHGNLSAQGRAWSTKNIAQVVLSTQQDYLAITTQTAEVNLSAPVQQDSFAIQIQTLEIDLSSGAIGSVGYINLTV